MNDNGRHLVKSLITARAYVKECSLPEDVEQVWEAYVEIAAVVYSGEVNAPYNVVISDDSEDK